MLVWWAVTITTATQRKISNLLFLISRFQAKLVLVRRCRRGEPPRPPPFLHDRSPVLRLRPELRTQDCVTGQRRKHPRAVGAARPRPSGGNVGKLYLWSCAAPGWAPTIRLPESPHFPPGLSFGRDFEFDSR